MNKELLLWVDDEIEYLRPHILFLEAKGYEVMTASNGQDALTICRRQRFDLILLDENMPGLSGLEVLPFLKELHPDTPVVMVTKSEEENIMEDAIGQKIADYLIKPVNPHQVLLSLKKNIHSKGIVADKTLSDYQQAYRRLSMQIDDCDEIEDWQELYKQLVQWELDLNEVNSPLLPMLQQQKVEANAAFGRFVKQNYEKWASATNTDNRPLMSPDIFKKKVFPMLDKGEKLFFVLIDNLRLDQWRVIKKYLSEHFTIEEELYTSILPTATQFARNAIFSGLMPLQIAKLFPDLWVDEDSEEGKNLNEEPMIRSCLERFRKKNSFSYTKVYDNQFLEKTVNNFSHLTGNDLNIIVLNFIDMLSHARTELHLVRQLVQSEAAYRSVTESWVKHSAVSELFQKIAEKGYRMILTTDHGAVQVNRPEKIIGMKDLTSNLRYKSGKSITYDPKRVFEVKNPEKVGLPAAGISSRYIFATDYDFFAYPNNFNHYAGYYRDTLQHGGISMEEMIIPLITLTPKGK